MIQMQDKDKLEHEKTVLDRIKVPHFNQEHQAEFQKFKDMLMKEIEQSRFLNEVLERRIQRMKEIMKVNIKAWLSQYFRSMKSELNMMKIFA